MSCRLHTTHGFSPPQCMRLEARVDVQVQAPPPQPAQQAGAKPKQRHQQLDSNVEKEVDRIIDSQDNEYVLSRPKCTFCCTPCINQLL